MKTSSQRIAAVVRQRIVTGAFGPGSRLPNRAELEREFRVGMPTVQKALDRLMRDGFVHARPGAGTFVCDHPPHLCRYALVLPDRRYRSRFYRALEHAAAAMAAEQGLLIERYYHHDPTEHERLEEEAADHRLAGVIFVHPQWDLWESLAVRTPNVPRVIVAGEPKLGIPAVDVDMPAFYEQALTLLAQRGCRRVAGLFVDPVHRGPALFAELAHKLGLETRPYWLCALANDQGHDPVCTTARLLMELSDDKRPDGLLIGDDNSFEAAMTGLLASPVRVPEQLQVVAHGNFPLPPGGEHWPVQRLGFDGYAFMAAAFKLLARQRAGRRTPALTRLRPVTAAQAAAVPTTVG